MKARGGTVLLDTRDGELGPMNEKPGTMAGLIANKSI
jgi:hypothetical protein